MSYSLEIRERPGYLHFVVTGVNSREAVEGYLGAIAQECAQRGCTRILIEERLTGARLGTVEVFAIVSGRSTRVAAQFDRIAYVDVHAEGNLMGFAEDVAVNRAVPVKLFATVVEAEQWLAGAPSP